MTDRCKKKLTEACSSIAYKYSQRLWALSQSLSLHNPEPIFSSKTRLSDLHYWSSVSSSYPFSMASEIFVFVLLYFFLFLQPMYNVLHADSFCETMKEENWAAPIWSKYWNDLSIWFIVKRFVSAFEYSWIEHFNLVVCFDLIETESVWDCWF